MAYNSFGATPAEREQQRKAVLYEVAARVSAFLEEDGPEKHGFEYREGQLDMAYDILDALKNQQHIAIEAGVGIGKSYAYLLPLLIYNSMM